MATLATARCIDADWGFCQRRSLCCVESWRGFPAPADLFVLISSSRSAKSAPSHLSRQHKGTTSLDDGHIAFSFLVSPSYKSHSRWLSKLGLRKSLDCNATNRWLGDPDALPSAWYARMRCDFGGDTVRTHMQLHALAGTHHVPSGGHAVHRNVHHEAVGHDVPANFETSTPVPMGATSSTYFSSRRRFGARTTPNSGRCKCSLTWRF